MEKLTKHPGILNLKSMVVSNESCLLLLRKAKECGIENLSMTELYNLKRLSTTVIRMCSLIKRESKRLKSELSKSK